MHSIDGEGYTSCTRNSLCFLQCEEKTSVFVRSVLKIAIQQC